MKTRIVSCILLLSCLVVLVIVKKGEAAEGWLTITSSHYDSHCGDTGGHTLLEALDGDRDRWDHTANENHWFILDLSQNYSITKIRGRSIMTKDPIDVDVYISLDKVSWGSAVKANITTWQDTSSWVEIDSTDKVGRYIKVEIMDTEDAGRNISWGAGGAGITIFDAYGEVPSPAAAAQIIHIIMD